MYDLLWTVLLQPWPNENFKTFHLNFITVNCFIHNSINLNLHCVIFEKQTMNSKVFHKCVWEIVSGLLRLCCENCCTTPVLNAPQDWRVLVIKSKIFLTLQARPYFRLFHWTLWNTMWFWPLSNIYQWIQTRNFSYKLLLRGVVTMHLWYGGASKAAPLSCLFSSLI